jgi:hypothetical protein
VALGGPCDSSTCDRCLAQDGWSACTRACSGVDGCNGGTTCVGTGYELGEYFCMIDCGNRSSSPSCPSACARIDTQDGSQHYYCPCQGCSVREANRSLGSPCGHATECTSGVCTGSVLRCAAVVGCVYDGVCSQTCTGAGECPAGYGCADARCLQECESGACDDCRSLADGQAVCDPRGLTGSACLIDEDCRSLTCQDRTCR